MNVLGDAYEYLIREFADDAGKKGGEFYTPRSVVRLIVELLEPAEGMRICDPTAGSAGMLIYAAQYVAEQDGDTRNLVLHGQERNLGTLAIGKLNLLLHGLRSARYEGGDVIADPQLLDEGGRLLLLRPGDRQSPVQPQGVGARLRPERLASPLRPLRRDPAQDAGRPRLPAAHARRHEPYRHGRGGDAARHPLSGRRRGHDPPGHRRGGPVRGDHRAGAQPLLRRQHPRGDLHPQQGQAAAAPRQGAVRRREPARLLPRRQGAERARTDEHISKIVEAFRAYEEVERFAHVAELDEIAANDFNLNISRYVDTTEPIEVPSVEEALAQLGEAERRRDEATERMDKLLVELGYVR